MQRGGDVLLPHNTLKMISVSWQHPAVALKCMDLDPLFTCIVIMLLVAFSCWLLSVIMHNYSQVDRIWSLVPWLYLWVFVAYSAREEEGLNARLLIMAVLSTAWGLRLTYNFQRKGGYNLKEEDYRWPALRETMHPLLFQVFNVFFIALYQNVLLLCFSTLPAAVAWQYRDTPLSSYDYAVSALFVAVWLIEVVADEQQWRFQTEKWRLRNAGKQPETDDQRRGFLTEGLFRYSRHPNFWAEHTLWWVFFLFSVTASKQWLNYSVIGALQLSLLFQGSTDYTEKLSLKKYPHYADYQKCTSRLLPWFPGKMPQKKE